MSMFPALSVSKTADSKVLFNNGNKNRITANQRAVKSGTTLPDKQSIPHINLLDQNRRLVSHLITYI